MQRTIVHSLVISFRTIRRMILGILFVFGLVAYCFVCLPIFLWRVFVTRILAPCFPSGLGNALSSMGSYLGTELSQDLSVHRPPKCGLVSSITFEGVIPVTELEESVKSSWIQKRYKGRHLFYPEFQQYAESFMGIMFWKWDKHFDLQNHIMVHSIDARGSDMESESFMSSFYEKLLNKPFPPKRSPWCIHLVHNYRNSQLSSKTMTILLLHSHHCLADGYSVLKLLIEDLLGGSLADVNMAKPSTNKPKSYESLLNLRNLIKFTNVLEELGHSVELSFTFNLPFRAGFGVKPSSKQIFARSPLIPIQKIKQIKKRFDVTFTDVLVSCLSAGVARSMQSTKNFSKRENLPMAIILPLKDHPKGLQNHFVFGNLKLPTLPNLTALERLEEAGKSVLELKNSWMPLVGKIYFDMVSYPVTPIAQYTATNRIFPVGLTNFPGPGIQVEYNGRKAVSADFAVGLLQGITGLCFMVVSYNDYIRIGVVAESCVMNKKCLSALVDYVKDEIDCLNEI